LLFHYGSKWEQGKEKPVLKKKNLKTSEKPLTMCKRKNRGKIEENKKHRKGRKEEKTVEKGGIGFGAPCHFGVLQDTMSVVVS
jgi:hypothetical protein